MIINPNRYFQALIIPMIITILLSACSIFRETPPTPTLSPTTAVPVNADQISQAMQGDHFYSDYRGLILSVKATAASIDHQGGHWIVELKTTEPTKVLCDFGAQEPSIQTGASITILTVAADAQREGSSVVLQNCSLK